MMPLDYLDKTGGALEYRLKCTSIGRLWELRPILSASRPPRRAFRFCVLTTGRGHRFIRAIAAVICIALVSNAANAEPMNFRLVQTGNAANCSDVCAISIAAEGEITDATATEFQSFLRAHKAGRGRVVIFLDSPGGKIVGGIELGRIFRKIGATAYVARIAEGEGGSALEPVGGVCFSACVYALMGAKRRIAPRDSKIGVHRMFAYDGGVRRYDNGEMAAMLRRYSSAMGIDPELVAATEQGGSDSLRILTPMEIARWRLASPGS